MLGESIIHKIQKKYPECYLKPIILGKYQYYNKNGFVNLRKFDNGGWWLTVGFLKLSMGTVLFIRKSLENFIKRQEKSTVITTCIHAKNKRSLRLTEKFLNYKRKKGDLFYFSVNINELQLLLRNKEKIE